MGNSQSSRADATKIKAPNVEPHLQSESARGRKSLSGVDHAAPKNLTNVEVQLVSTSGDDSEETESMEYDGEDEETDEEIDAGLAERHRILEDAKLLKQYAAFHLHPEESVETTSPFAKGRNYFNRPSAPDQESVEESEERARILEEVQMLKMYANFHFHPENPVATSNAAAATATARNYFTRASAPKQESLEDSEERAKILEEAAILKMYAEFHFHPEKPVQSQVDPCAFGRNYFTRPSAPEHLTQEKTEEREQVLLDCLALKTYAGFHLHPERPVETTDYMACARNFFTRASADEYFDEDDAEERQEILKEAAMLKEYAGYHLHPEKPVCTTDPMACARNFFTRASADEYFTEDNAEEHEEILAECLALKTYAGYHLHPERPVESQGDALSFGRNYFGRASAPEQATFEEAEERAKILQENAMFKMYAGFHLHPEKPVKATMDPTSFGRNYFARASAPEQDTFEEAEERATILAEVAMLKQYAGYHLHPERPVESQCDALSFGRNYFGRASAPKQDTFEEAEERAQILEDVAMLKMYAGFHFHPERPISSTIDPTAFGRNYFSRASAPERNTCEEAEERATILEEAAMLKQYAGYHLHPERPVESTDFMACGRNYFTRASAPEYFTEEEAEEREQILAEVAMLKLYADFHLHPEKPVKVTNAMFGGRNFFDRYSAPTSTIALITSQGRDLRVHEEHEELDDSEYGYDNHFEFDEDLTDLDDFRQSLTKVISERLAHSGYLQPINFDSYNEDNDEQEGKLSRSPSSIMLFGYEENAY